MARIASFIGSGQLFIQPIKQLTGNNTLFAYIKSSFYAPTTLKHLEIVLKRSRVALKQFQITQSTTKVLVNMEASKFFFIVVNLEKTSKPVKIAKYIY
jgi:hypothetical protein